MTIYIYMTIYVYIIIYINIYIYIKVNYYILLYIKYIKNIQSQLKLDCWHPKRIEPSCCHLCPLEPSGRASAKNRPPSHGISRLFVQGWTEKERKTMGIGLVQGKIYRKPCFFPSNIGLSCKFSHHPILWPWEKLWTTDLRISFPGH